MSSVTFVNGLYIQTSLAVNNLQAASAELPMLPYICAKMMVWKFIYKFVCVCVCVFSYPGDSVSFAGVQELGSISGSLPDDPGGIICMRIFIVPICHFVGSAVIFKNERPFVG